MFNGQSPGLYKVPVLEMPFCVLGICRTRPMLVVISGQEQQESTKTYHEIQVHIVRAKILQRRVDAILHAMVPGIVKLGGQKDFTSWHARLPDALSYFGFIAICERSVDVAVAFLEGNLDGIGYLMGLALPCSQPNCGDCSACVQLERLPRAS